MEALHDFERCHEIFQGHPCGGRKLLEARREIAALVNVSDNHLRQRHLLGRQLRVAHLLEHHLLQRLPGDERVEHELPAFLVFLARAARCVALRVVVPPLLVELREFVELGLKIIRWLGAFLLGNRVGGQVCRRLGEARRLGNFVRLFAGLSLNIHLAVDQLLKHRVLFQFGLDLRAQLEDRCLEKRKRLLELGRQHHRLRHLLRQIQALSH